jgi:hypothetical protein
VLLGSVLLQAKYITFHSALQIGLSTYLELFQRNPETLSLFSFLKHLSKEDLEFYSQLKNHAVRVTGVLTMLVRQVRSWGLQRPLWEINVHVRIRLHNENRILRNAIKIDHFVSA